MNAVEDRDKAEAKVTALRAALATAKEALKSAEQTIGEFVSDIEDGGSLRFSWEYVQRHRDARDYIRSAIDAAGKGEDNG
jgi:hypothetical protein